MNIIIRLLFFGVLVTIFLFSEDVETYLITWGAYIAFVVIGLYFVMTKRSKIILYKEVWFFLFFVVYSGLSLLWAKYDKNQSLSFLIMMLFFVTLSCNIFKSREDLDFLLNSNIWAGVVLSIYAPLIHGFNNYIGDMMDGMRMGAEVGGENTVGICTAMSLLFSLGCFLYKKNRWYIAAMIPLLFTCLSTGSRTALLAIIIGSGVLLFIYYYSTKRCIISYSFKIILIFSAFLIVGYYVLKNTPAFNPVYARFDEFVQVILGNEESAEGIGEGKIRTELIHAGLGAFKDNPIGGIGFQNGRYLFRGFRGKDSYSLHNNYVDILCGGGIIGFVIFYSLYLLLIVKLSKKIKHCWEAGLALGTIIIVLIAHMSGVFYSLKFYYPWLIIWIVAANLPNETNKATQSELTSETEDVKDYDNCNGLGWNPSR